MEGRRLKIVKVNGLSQYVDDVTDYGITPNGKSYYYVKNDLRVFMSMYNILAIGWEDIMW